MRNGGEKRGNSKDRKARKLWMLATWGDGEVCPCIHCGKELDYKHVQADRIIPGGSYKRGNIQPSCGPCNNKRGNNMNYRRAA